MNHSLTRIAMSRFILNIRQVAGSAFPAALVVLSLLFGMRQSARGFAFWGPPEAYQTANLGYNRLDVVDYPGNAFSFQPASPASTLNDFSFFPHNIGEEYRWNVPNLFYAYDPPFVDYFGSNGVHSVDAAFDLMNALPKTSELVLDDFPLDESRFNFTAQAFHLFDLKSATIEAIVTRLGLADPQMWTWTLRERGALPGGCPDFIYTVFQRNFDPVAWTPSSYVNGELFSYFIDQPCPSDFRGDRSDAEEFKVDPLDKVLTAVASPKIIWPNINYYGMFHTSLTRDDVAGLYYLYNTNQMNTEQTPPGVL